MTLNELLAKQNILNALYIKDGDKQLNDELKVKMVRLKIAFNKIKKQFEEDVQKFTKDLIPEELQILQEKPEDERTSEDIKKIEELVAKVNSEYNEFLTNKGLEVVTVNTNITFSEKDFDEIIIVNMNNNTEINEVKLASTDLMEAFYTLFIEKH